MKPELSVAIALAARYTAAGAGERKPTAMGETVDRKTTVEIRGDHFFVLGQSTDAGSRIAGLLTNTRIVQGVFDDPHPKTVIDKPWNNYAAVLSEYCSRRHLDPGKSNYLDGYRCSPGNGSANSEREEAPSVCVAGSRAYGQTIDFVRQPTSNASPDVTRMRSVIRWAEEMKPA